MKPSPVINVAPPAPSAPSKPASGSSSDQSFGQVLAQQVHGTQASSSSSSSSNGGTQNAAPATTGTANGNDTAAGGKTVKSKHDQDDSATTGTAQASTDTSATNGSAQLLALVSNVQQTATGTASSSTSSTDTSNGTGSAIGTLAANSASSAQAALASFQAAAVNSAASDKTAVADTASATSDFAQEIKNALPQDSDAETKDVTTGGTQSGAAAAKTNGQTALTNVDTQNTTPTQAAADLAASAQKDIQADIANLDQAAAKSADTVRNTIATTNAAPAMVNNAQVSDVANPASAAGDKLTPQVGSPDWDQALGQKVVWMVAGGQQSASLTLNPPDLGPMQVVLNVTNSHATATFTAAQPEVRQALEAAMPKLREMLGDAGIQLGQTSVNAGNAQQQNFAGQSSQGSSGRNGDSSVGALDDIGTVVAQTATKISSGVGLVDTFA